MRSQPQQTRGDPRAHFRLLPGILAAALAGFFLWTVLSLAAPPPRPSPESVQTQNGPIRITDSGFAPAIFSTTVNLPVVWLNDSSATHTLRSGAAPLLYLPEVRGKSGAQTATTQPRRRFTSGLTPRTDALFRVELTPGERFTFTFAITGTYPFHLEDAPAFTGAVIVAPDNSAPPPDPAAVAPPLNPTSGTSLQDASAFLYTGDNPIQTGVVSGTIQLLRAAVLRGRVTDGAGDGLPGVRIGVVDHPELGQTLSRADGFFDLAVNGGGPLTLRYELEGFLPAQRSVDAPWQAYAWLPEVTLLPYDAAVTQIDLGAAQMQVAQGSPVSDSDGSRQATIFFPPGTTARQVLAGGRSAPLSTLSVRVTEFTVGEGGPEAMPAQLPPSSGYTYAAEFSVDEAVAAGALDVQFNQPLPVFVENFLGFPVGGAVPAGYYDRAKGQWVASANGRVIQILSINGGLAEVDIDGSGNPATPDALTALGVSAEERSHLAQLYAPGQSLWRVPVSHFTPWDFNWPYGPPDDAEPPPGDEDSDDHRPDDPNEECGSVIGCEDQSLGESLPIAGTPFRLHYRSDRTPGRLDNNTLVIPVSGPTVPASLQAMRVEVNIAGRLYGQSFAPAPNRVYTLTWDGKDAYGRALPGAQVAHIQVHFDYAPQFYAARADFVNSFARSEAFGPAVSGLRNSARFTLSKAWTKLVRFLDLPALGMAGWSLNIQHSYQPDAQIALLGDGSRRTSAARSLADVIFTVAGNGDNSNFGLSGDGGPATAAAITPADIDFGPDGALYIADRLNGRIRRVGLDGVITSVASGFPSPTGIAAGADGALYVADNSRNRLYRVGRDGAVTTVAGNGTAGYNGEGIPALSAQLQGLGGLDVAPDGSLYFAEWGNFRVRRVGVDGIITTVAGNGSQFCDVTEGGRATDACLLGPRDVAVAPDGSLYIVDSTTFGGPDRIFHVSADGAISTVAGGGKFVNDKDGVSALLATPEFPVSVALGAGGRFYFADSNDDRVRVVQDGVINTAAGNRSEKHSGDGGPAPVAGVWLPGGLAVDPLARLYIIEAGANRIRRLQPALPGVVDSDILLPAPNGAEVYVFDKNGRHLKTLDALTGAVGYAFGYNAAGYLISITDGSGNLTAIERAGAKPTAIVAPGGQRTLLTVNSDGWLASVSNPLGESYALSYGSGGLLTQLTDPLGRSHNYSYDGLGRLVKEEDPANGSTSLARMETSSGYTVTTTTALGRVRFYSVEKLPTGAIRRSVTEAGGARTTTLIHSDGSQQISYADGTVVTMRYGPDPRWGMPAPVAVETTTTTPGGRKRVVTLQRTATLSADANPLGLVKLTESFSDNGAVSTYIYDALSRVLTATTAAGRISTAAVDAQGRLIRQEVAGIAPALFAYDSRGLLTGLSAGSGASGRTSALSYDDARHLTAAQNPLGETTVISYDGAGRPLLQTLADGRSTSLAYDAAGNLTSLTPPGRPTHTFGYTALDLPALYSPPDVHPGSEQTQLSYTAEGRLAQTTRPDGETVAFGYDSAGRLNGVTQARGTISYAYHPTGGQLSSISAPDGIGLNYSYDGRLLTGQSWSGPVAGSVGYSYDDRFRLTATTVNGGNGAAFQYSQDNLLAQAGALALSRNGQNGLLTGSALGGVADSWGYNGFGEVISYSASYNGGALYSLQYQRDKLGRITQKSESIGGGSAVYTYTYDLAGRLTAVRRNGLPYESYSYDANNNRLNITSPGGTIAGVYDAQDRLTQSGATTYGYTAAGELISRATGGQNTLYSYDALGNLLAVTLPDGTAISYLVDGQNRRIGKRVNGVPVQGFLYESSLRPIAELDGAGGLVSRFVYATRVNVPDYLVKGGITYRILTDQLGSPRLVVNVATGAVAQRMEYDSLGRVLTDTAPGFQPFGFAGGLYDPQTKLTRFGAREYDAATGRWTAKDPLLFLPGETNLYAYASNDPVNGVDPDGLFGWTVGFTIGAGAGWGFSFSGGYGFDLSRGFFAYGSPATGIHAGISAGCGLDLTVYNDFDTFTGAGSEVGVNLPIGGVAVSGGDSPNAVSISVGPSLGADVHFYTGYTGVLGFLGKGITPKEDLPPAAPSAGSSGSGTLRSDEYGSKTGTCEAACGE